MIAKDDPREKSKLMNQLRKESGLTASEASEYLGMALGSYRSKVHRNNFTLEDFIIATYLCNKSICIVSNDGTVEQKLDVDRFLGDDVRTRIKGLVKKKYNEKYNELKKAMDDLKAQYGEEVVQ